MIASNESLFFLHAVVGGVALLAAARLGRLYVVGAIVTCTILMNIAVQKQMSLFGMTVTGGNVLFGLVFLGVDILNEHYGKRVARNAVFVGFVTVSCPARFATVVSRPRSSITGFSTDSVVASVGYD